MTNNKSCSTLIDGIAFRYKKDPKGQALVFLKEEMKEVKATVISNEQFYHDMQRYATGFAAKGIRPGEIVLLTLDHGYNLLACFWGLICCGAIPSVLPYWRPDSDIGVYARKVKHLAAVAYARAVVTIPNLYSTIKTLLTEINCLVLSVDEINGFSDKDSEKLPKLQKEQIALLQFTSGTTSQPRGIQFPHRAVLNNIAATASAFQITRYSVQVSWLPFHHDMGLIFHIMLLIHGGLQVLMSPQTWLRHPEKFLQAISAYRGTMAIMPNFGFDYCSQRVKREDIRNVDLSSLRILANGSEPVMWASMEQFRDHFLSYGFRPEALTVAYGMAENVCAISVTPPEHMPQVDWVSADNLHATGFAIEVGKGSAGARAIPSCGYPFEGIELAIVDEEWKKLADREIGEIVIRSNTLFTGYCFVSKGNKSYFRGGWFRTGDVGYLVADQLYVCDRKKDLIIVGGRNIHPQAIENIALNAFGTFAGRCAAFGVSDQNLGTELPVLVVEQRKQVEDAEKQNLIQQVRKQVLEELDVAISDIRLVPKGWVLKTTSGKIARAANREKYLNEIKNYADEQNTIFSDKLIPEEVKQNLINLFEKILGTTGIDERDNFFTLGGDSLSALRALLSIERKFGQEISAEEFYREPTIKSLAEVICKKSNNEAVMEIDASPRLRNDEIVDCRKSQHFPRLFEHVLHELKLKIKQKAVNIIPAWLYGHKCVQNILFSKEVQLMRSFYKLLENPLQSEKNFIMYGLIFHVPHSMRKGSQNIPPSYWLKKWSLHADMDTLEKAYRKGNGVIMICWHAHYWLLRFVLEFMMEPLHPTAYSYIGQLKELLPKGINDFPDYEKKQFRMMIYLDQLVKAKKTLIQGGIVFMLPDGYQGLSTGFSIQFHGRMRIFRAGFAEIAAETSAVVIPISFVTDISKRKITMSSLKPLNDYSLEMPHSERIRGLVNQYVAYFDQEWVHCPELVTPAQMKKHINLTQI